MFLLNKAATDTKYCHITKEYSGGIVIQKLPDKVRKLAHILRVTTWRSSLMAFHVAAGAEHTRVLRSLGKINTVLDIGANRGQFALVARHCFPNANIVSFEPLQEAAAVYSAVFSKDPDTRLVEKAVGPEPGKAKIHLSERDDSSSLLQITERQNVLFPGTEEKGVRTIQVARLVDELSIEEVTSPALLKLDVQGFELSALEGCEELLHRFKWAYVECSFVELYKGQSLADEVIAWLRQRGMMLCGVYNITNDPEGLAIQADFLFQRVREDQGL